MSTSCRCRLCGGEALVRFNLQIMGKYDAAFSECVRCNCLQTDEPFWLSEAYDDPTRVFDTGTAHRNQKMQAYVWFLTKLLKMGPNVSALDWGGGDGLFTRMLRDIGIDAYHSDKYSTNTYAAGFDGQSDKKYDLITAFEVYEHLPDPAREIDQIFSHEPEVHFLSTSIYKDQGKDWQYIWPTTGRHVFFYSRTGMEYLSRKYGYSLLCGRSYTLFHRKSISGIRRRFLRRLVNGKHERTIMTLFMMCHGKWHFEKDRQLICERLLDI